MIPRWSSSLILTLSTLLSPAEIIIGGEDIFLDHNLQRAAESGDQEKRPNPDPVGDDLILFTNGDLMHGIFGGIDEGLLWDRNDQDRAIKFGVPSVKQIIFNSSNSVKLSEKTSFITLISGDRIPGEIISLDDKNLVIKSTIAGDLTIPRPHLHSITPNPFGGKLHYVGPYTSEGWIILDRRKDQKSKSKKEPKEKPPKSSSWIHSGDSFYSLGSEPLVLADAKLPDVGRLRFHANWKGRFNLYVALHADLVRMLPPEKEEDKKEAQPGILPPAGAIEIEDEDTLPVEENIEPKEEEEPTPPREENLLDLRKGTGFQSIPWINPSKMSHPDLFGSCYTVLINSSYPRLTRNYFSETGIAKQTHLSSTRGYASLPENGEAEIEIRFDRNKAIVMLFINGKYVSQWNDTEGYLGKGRALGIYNPSSTNRVKISDIVVSSWTGVTDSAASLENEDRDIVLLANGTDRFSGTVTNITGGQAHLKTAYTDIKIPLTDLSEIVFKSATTTDLEDEKVAAKFTWESDPITVVYHPYGRIKMIPLSATPTTLSGSSPFLGKLRTDLKPAVMLRFSEDLPDLSDWFDDF